VSKSIRTAASLTSVVTLAACTYSAPDYGACDPDRPSELIRLSDFEGPLEGMEASVRDVVAEIEAEHDGYVYVADDRTRPAEPPDDAAAFVFSLEVDEEAAYVPVSEGCEIDRLELTATTRVLVPGGEDVAGAWSFSLSRDTAEETSGVLSEQQAEALLEAIGATYEGDEMLDMSFGGRFVDDDDRARATFPGLGVIATLGGPSTPSTVLAQFGWDAASE